MNALTIGKKKTKKTGKDPWHECEDKMKWVPFEEAAA